MDARPWLTVLALTVVISGPLTLMVWAATGLMFTGRLYPLSTLPNMAFAVLKEADLIHAEKAGKSILYHLKLSVLEEALLGFVHSFGVGEPAPEPVPSPNEETAR